MSSYSGETQSYKELSRKLVNKDNSVDDSLLHNMGFEQHSIGNNKDTGIIVPDDMRKGETLPVVIMQGGDGADKRYYTSYFNNYRQISGNDLPRAIYVLAPNYGHEDSDNNAYQYAKSWMDSKGVTPSQVGIQTFSGGGGTGVMMANQAARDNKDIPVTLLLLDAVRDGENGRGRSFSNSLENLAKNKNIVVVGATKEFGGLLRDVGNIIPDRTYKIKLKDGDYESHSGVRSHALYYDFLLSFMGLSTKLPDNKGLFKFRGDGGDDDTKLDNSVSLNDILKNIDGHASELGSSAMDVLETSSNLFALDEYINELNTEINSFSSIEGGQAGGNDLIALEANIAASLTKSVSSISKTLALDTVTIRGVGENIENADKKLSLDLDKINSFATGLSAFEVGANLIKDREKIIEVPKENDKSEEKDNKDKDDDDGNEQNNNGNKGYTPGGYGPQPEPTNNTKPKPYQIGITEDGGKVIATYDGKEITSLTIQYDINKADYIEQNKEYFDKIAESIKQNENEGIIEVSMKSEIFVNKDLDAIKEILKIK